MDCNGSKDILIANVSCSDRDRYLPPTDAAIELMKTSLADIGQINAIGVYPVTHNTYRLISGATRFRAASELGWTKIRATIWTGTAVDFQIHELIENADRRRLTSQQRKEMRAKIKELQRQRLADVQPGKGGRGNKGGLREAARQEGISEPTARRRAEPKLRHNIENDAVSAGDKPEQPPAPRAARFAKYKASFDLMAGDIKDLDGICSRMNISRSDALRRAVREWIEHNRIVAVSSAM